MLPKAWIVQFVSRMYEHNKNDFPLNTRQEKAYIDINMN
jgi:hypothetical protein